MIKYVLEIAFHGGEFSGWQVQPNSKTVQGTIESKLHYLYNQKIILTGAGRTDAGVHALSMTASFIPPQSPQIKIDELRFALNKLLPNTIIIKSTRIEDEDFNARFSALGKAYTYIITTSPPGPFLYDKCFYYTKNLNLNEIKSASKYLIGKQDFTAFGTNLNKSKKNPIRKIEHIDVKELNNFICITFIGESFLHKMVRMMVGTLLKIGEGKWCPYTVYEILASKRHPSSQVVPACGLYLMKVFYNQNEKKEFSVNILPFCTQINF